MRLGIAFGRRSIGFLLGYFLEGVIERLRVIIRANLFGGFDEPLGLLGIIGLQLWLGLVSHKNHLIPPLANAEKAYIVLAASGSLAYLGFWLINLAINAAISA
jgi:hypothetical protein